MPEYQIIMEKAIFSGRKQDKEMPEYQDKLQIFMMKLKIRYGMLRISETPMAGSGV